MAAASVQLRTAGARGAPVPLRRGVDARAREFGADAAAAAECSSGRRAVLMLMLLLLLYNTWTRVTTGRRAHARARALLGEAGCCAGVCM